MQNIPKPIRRKNHNGILIELEAFLDLDIGVIKYIERHYDYDILKPEFVGKSVKELQLVKWKDKDFFKNIFRENFSNSLIDEIFETILKTNTEEIIKKAPEVQSIKRMISVFAKTGKDIAYCVILVRKSEYLPYLKNRFPKLTFLDASENQKIDFTPYARFIVEDMNRLIEYGVIEFTHITVLSYPKNFTTSKGEKVILLPQPILLYGTNNQFDIIDPLLN